MFLQDGAHFEKFSVRLWHFVVELQHRLWSADTGDDVFTLGVDEELPIELVRSVCRVTSESNAGTGVVTRVPVNHRLHVHSSAPFSRDVVLATIDDCAVIHPGTEDGTSSTTELIPWVFREGLARTIFDQSFESLHQLLLVVRSQVAVDDVFAISRMLELFDHSFERLMIFTFALLHTQHHVTIHLDEAAIAIPSEALVLGGSHK